MIRLLFFIIIAIAFSSGFIWINSTSGLVTFNWLGYNIEINITFFILLLIISFFIFLIVFELISLILNSPLKLKKIFSKKDDEVNYNYLEKGLFGLISGDIKEAESNYNILKNRLGEKSKYKKIFNAYEAKLLQNECRYLEAKEAYKKLLDDKKTKFFAVKGLIETNSLQGNLLETKKYAEIAYNMKPDFTDGAHSLLELYKKSGNIDEVFDFLNKYKRKNFFKKDHHNQIDIDKEFSWAWLNNAEQAFNNADNKTKSNLALNMLIKALKYNYANEKALNLFILKAGELCKISDLRKHFRKHWEHKQNFEPARDYLNTLLNQKGIGKKTILREIATLEKIQKNDKIVNKLKAQFLD